MGYFAGRAAAIMIGLFACAPHASAQAPDAAAGERITLAGYHANRSTFAGCGHYVVLSCHRSWPRALDLAGGSLFAIDTDDYPNFRNGWYCVVDGPHSVEGAQARRKGFLARIPDAYVKDACW